MPGLFNVRQLVPMNDKNTEKRSAGQPTGTVSNTAEEFQVASSSGLLRSTSIRSSANPAEPAVKREINNQPSLGRAKQVTDPIGENLKFQLCEPKQLSQFDHFGSNPGSSSGSEHEPNSVCLVDMVHKFIEEDSDKMLHNRSRCGCQSRNCPGLVCLTGDDDEDGCSVGELIRIVQGLSQCSNNDEKRLLADVSIALEKVNSVPDALCREDSSSCSGGCVRRAVMTKLRDAGYNAAVCKSRWDHSRGFPGGDYEYIDVLGEISKRDRLLVDIDFRSQFQIARPTVQHSVALQSLPRIFVGRPERLQQLVDLMTDATKRSLKLQGMHLPPWRKPEYMRAKWLAPYRRTTNEIPVSVSHSGCYEGQRDDASQKILDGEPHVDVVIFKGMVMPLGNREENLFLPKGAGAKHHAVRACPSDTKISRDPVVSNSGWQLPSVNPRTGGAGQCKKSGLGAVLREAGLANHARLQGARN